MEGSIHIGTSGWSYKHWRNLYYPPKLPASQWLPFYAADFDTTEINSSFYKLPSEETVLKWATQVPDNFLFCPKMSRFLTHMKKLTDPEEPLERFFKIFQPLKKMTGPVLLQLPTILKFNYDTAAQLYRLMKSKYRRYAFVMEVRHETWLEQNSLALMSKYDIGLVISQSGYKFPYSEKITAKNIYLRFHGPTELYASSYSDRMLAAFAEKMRRWAEQGYEVWAFFNNDIHGFAPTDAKKLKALLLK
jgi:uncharacterized protein YecE (DUF72 family)